MLELRDDNPEELQRKHDLLVETLEALQLSYAWPSLYGDDIQKALELRLTIRTLINYFIVIVLVLTVFEEFTINQQSQPEASPQNASQPITNN